MTQGHNNSKTHIMVDLETLSTRTNARIIAIGAVKFSAKDGIYSKFYQAVTAPAAEILLHSGDLEGFNVSAETLVWWSEQSDEARAVFSDPNAVPIAPALESFTSWALEGTEKADVIVWGNGAAFDNAILSTAYTLCALEQPWNFWNDRCYRTAKSMHPETPLERVGTYHNALDDAESQAEHMLRFHPPAM